MDLFNNEKFPNLEKIFNIQDYLLYSSSFVEQTYHEIYGNKIRKNVSEHKFINTAVLLERLNGEGIDSDKKLCDLDIQPINTHNIPEVGTISGELVIEVENATDMCLNKVKTESETYVSYGSFENYHPIIQEHLTRDDTYYGGDVWVTIIPVNEKDEEHRFHFNQIVQKSIFDIIED